MKQKSDMTIQFKGLESGSYEYQYTLDGDFFSEYENEEFATAEVDFQVHLEKSERMLVFNFSFNGKVKSQCDRCLGDLEVPISGEEMLCVKFGNQENHDDEDVLFLPDNENQIDLSQWMYEYAVLAYPMRHVHPEGECQNDMVQLLQENGKSENEEEQPIDPRWEALKNLK